MADLIFLWVLCMVGLSFCFALLYLTVKSIIDRKRFEKKYGKVFVKKWLDGGFDVKVNK